MTSDNPFAALAARSQTSQATQNNNETPVGSSTRSSAEPTRPRLVLYHQTHFHNNQYISPLPLLSENTRCTHVIIAAIHLNSAAGNITINDIVYTHAKLAPLYADVEALKAGGIKVMGMLGGAAKGSFARVDQDSVKEFMTFYRPLVSAIRTMGLQGLDLDVEEEMSLPGIVRLILSLKHDFGPDFIISLAPVAAAMMQKTRWWDPQRRNLSGFDYFDLEKAVGSRVSWYNCQFYNGWGTFDSIEGYEKIAQAGWDMSKIVAGIPTSREVANSGHVDEEIICINAIALMDMYGSHFGGIMGWEFWNSWTAEMVDAGVRGQFWRWAKLIGNTFESYLKEQGSVQ